MTNSVPLLQIDAFADRPFAGNSAAVCLLEQETPEAWMQAFAAEMNLAETAYVRPLPPDDRGKRYELRWFTPEVEAPLCGHATLATAHALWSEGRAAGGESIRFVTKSGELSAARDGDLIELDFPATPAARCDADPALLAALGIEKVLFAGRTSVEDTLLVLESAEQVRSLRPDFARLAKLPGRGVMATAPSDEEPYDFVSRFFAPAVGIDEDPVTGSAHCGLGPYWAQRLGKQQLVGRQLSRRGGTVRVRLAGDRVKLGGRAITIFRGSVSAEALPTEVAPVSRSS
ncbi:MAG TPA: PhzF family phenazine biosynthesis protein [Pirellulaceae bacterium]|nr:PhzF family phenazine biosynthesis protein [Pirellulaceae bacterium]